MLKIRLGIRTKFLLSLFVLILLMGTVFIASSIYRISDLLNTKIEENGLDVVKVYSNLVAPYVLESDYITIKHISAELVEESEVKNISIVDAEGRIWSSTAHFPTNYFANHPLVKKIGGQGYKAYQRSTRDNQGIIEFTSPIRALGDIAYIVILEVRTNVVDNEIENQVVEIIILAVCLMILAFFISLRLSSLLTQPIKKLVDGTLEISNGNYSYRIDVNTSDELADLTQSFNGMASRLQQDSNNLKHAEKKLIEHQESLERQVADRTQKYLHLAQHDPLTGLINRPEFERRTNYLLTLVAQEQSEHAVCFIDLDQFKVINDTCGHTAGDELLRQIGMVLQGTVRKQDTIARLGGDEFGVLIECCSLEQAQLLAQSLLKNIQDYQFIWEGQSFRVGASIGLVSVTESTPNFTELMKMVDSACYVAKDLGRNRIHTYHLDDKELAQRHVEMQWVSRIHQALEENRFVLYAQPIVPLNTSSEKHYEILLRMRDANGSIIPPGAFLPAAERYNLIELIDSWVIKNTFRTISENPEFIEQINSISINLSGPSFTKAGFLDFITNQLKESGISSNKICFEITETVAITNLSIAISVITSLKKIGVRFALDDFGSGISSFGYLKNLPVDYLKIDGMFVKDMVDDPIDHAMVKSINDIGQLMGMQTIAEFVENNEIKGMLKEMGVNYAQGYGLGKPEPFEALLNYYRS